MIQYVKTVKENVRYNQKKTDGKKRVFIQSLKIEWSNCSGKGNSLKS